MAPAVAAVAAVAATATPTPAFGVDANLVVLVYNREDGRGMEMTRMGILDVWLSTSSERGSSGSWVGEGRFAV